jgi:hypothetical protein
MDLSAPIHELKRKAKLMRRQSGIPHNEALNCIAKEEGYSSWSLLIRKYEDQKPRPQVMPSDSYVIDKLPFGPEYRAEAIKLANHSFEEAMRRMEPDNPEITQKLWSVDDYVDNHHLKADMLPIDSDYALSLIEAFLWHHVVDLAVKADEMAE